MATRAKHRPTGPPWGPPDAKVQRTTYLVPHRSAAQVLRARWGPLPLPLLPYPLHQGDLLTPN